MTPEPFGSPELVVETSEEMTHPDYYGAKVLACVKCGGRLFEVGSGSCLTLVRCQVCQEPVMVHSG